METNNKNTIGSKGSGLSLVINKIRKTYDAIDVIKCACTALLLSAHIYISMPIILQLNGQNSSSNLKSLIRPSGVLHKQLVPFKRKCGNKDLKCLKRQAEHAAAKYKLNPQLFKRIITIESRWRINAYNSTTNDYGLVIVTGKQIGRAHV